MRRRLMLKSSAGVSPVLPAEYQQVEWIGYQGKYNYITLPVMWDCNEIHAKIAKLSVPTGRSVFPSAFSSINTLVFNPWGSIETDGSRNTSVIPSVTISDTFDFTDFVITLNASLAEQAFYLGLGYNENNFCPELKFKELEVYKNSVLVLHGIMCYRKADGKIGIYDAISQTFCESSGTWAKGADI